MKPENGTPARVEYVKKTRAINDEGLESQRKTQRVWVGPGFSLSHSRLFDRTSIGIEKFASSTFSETRSLQVANLGAGPCFRNFRNFIGESIWPLVLEQWPKAQVSGTKPSGPGSHVVLAAGVIEFCQTPVDQSQLPRPSGSASIQA